MIVRISDPAVMLFFVLVLLGVGSWVTTLPKRFDKLLALFVGLETFEGLLLFIRDDVQHVLVQPLFPGAHQLFFKLLLFLRNLLFCKRFSDRIAIRTAGTAAPRLLGR